MAGPPASSRLGLALVALSLVAACAHGPGDAPPLSKSRIAEIVAARPQRRRPHQRPAPQARPRLLGFIGVRPGMVALDLSAGGGYTTELLARAVGRAAASMARARRRAPLRRGRRQRPKAAWRRRRGLRRRRHGLGEYDVTRLGRGRCRRGRCTATAARTSAQALAERAAIRRGNIVPSRSRSRRRCRPMSPPAASTSATLMFNYHDLGHMGVDRDRLNRAVFAALKPGGIYVVADHAGRAGTGISEAATLHRVEEAFVAAEVEARRLSPASPRAASCAIRPTRAIANTPEPPQPKDEFVLKFVKP